MSEKKRWFDDWEVTYGGDSPITVKLPHSERGPTSIVIKKGSVNFDDLSELAMIIDCALYALTNPDDKRSKEK